MVPGGAAVLGWRLPMEQTEIENHEIESSRRIIATRGARSAPTRCAQRAEGGERVAALGSFRVI